MRGDSIPIPEPEPIELVCKKVVEDRLKNASKADLQYVVEMRMICQLMTGEKLIVNNSMYRHVYPTKLPLVLVRKVSKALSKNLKGMHFIILV